MKERGLSLKHQPNNTNYLPTHSDNRCDRTTRYNRRTIHVLQSRPTSKTVPNTLQNTIKHKKIIPPMLNTEKCF